MSEVSPGLTNVPLSEGDNQQPPRTEYSIHYCACPRCGEYMELRHKVISSQHYIELQEKCFKLKQKIKELQQ